MEFFNKIFTYFIFPNISSKTYLYNFVHFLLLVLVFLLLLFVRPCLHLLVLSLLCSRMFLLGLGCVLLLLCCFLCLLDVAKCLLVYGHLLCEVLLLVRLKCTEFFLLVSLIVQLQVLHVVLPLLIML